MFAAVEGKRPDFIGFSFIQFEDRTDPFAILIILQNDFLDGKIKIPFCGLQLPQLVLVILQVLIIEIIAETEDVTPPGTLRH